MIKDIITILTKIKKSILPTKYDKEQKKLYQSRLEFYSHFIKPNDLCFDIGANYGNRTEIFLNLGAKVVALEPQQKCIQFLQKKYCNKAIYLQKGAGASIEIKNFYVSEKYDQLSSFSEDWMSTLKDRIGDVKADRVEQIEIVTLDSLIDKYGKPTFIKIDVEGFELEVLKGLTKEFDFLSFEYAVPEMKENLNDCIKILYKHYPNCRFNYTVGEDENSTLKKATWVDFIEMQILIHTEEFIKTYAGDIYVKY